MRKHIVLVLLVPILALTLISCDADMRSSFANFLGGLGGNVYGDLVKPDYSGVEEADAAIAAIEGQDPGIDNDGKATIFGGVQIELDADEVESILPPMPEAEQAALKNTIKEATKTEEKKQKFAEEQKKPASDDQKKAASGTIAAINATIEAVADPDAKELLEKLKLPEIEEDNITQADVLILQLMTDLIVDTLDALDGGGGIDPDKVESLINDALFTIEIAETLSGASSIIFTDEISLFDLLPKNEDEGNKSMRAAVEVNDPDGILHTIRGIFPSLIKMMGVTRIGNEYTYTHAKYMSFVLNQRAYRASMEQAIKLDDEENRLKGTAKFSENTLIKYLLSVLVTENHEYMVSLGTPEASSEMIEVFLNDNPKFGDSPTPNNKITEIEDKAITGIYTEDALEGFFKNSWGIDSFRRVLRTLVGINNNIVDKYQMEFISDEISELLDKLEGKTDADDWFDEIFGD